MYALSTRFLKERPRTSTLPDFVSWQGIHELVFLDAVGSLAFLTELKDRLPCM